MRVPDQPPIRVAAVAGTSVPSGKNDKPRTAWHGGCRKPEGPLPLSMANMKKGGPRLRSIHKRHLTYGPVQALHD